MRIKALTTFTVFTGEMKVFNEGDIGELSDVYATQAIEAAQAEQVDADPLDHDADGAPGGSLPHEPPALTGKNKADLLAIADAEGVVVDEVATKAEIITAIEAARIAADLGDDDDAPAI